MCRTFLGKAVLVWLLDVCLPEVLSLLPERWCISLSSHLHHSNIAKYNLTHSNLQWNFRFGWGWKYWMRVLGIWIIQKPAILRSIQGDPDSCLRNWPIYNRTSMNRHFQVVSGRWRWFLLAIGYKVVLRRGTLCSFFVNSQSLPPARPKRRTYSLYSSTRCGRGRL